MCTAATYKTKDFYFGRTLDYEFSYGDEVTVTPRNFPFHLRHAGDMDSHYAMIGMAYVLENHPLYYEATNEKGLSMAGLNFPGNACFTPPEEDWITSDSPSARARDALKDSPPERVFTLRSVPL